MVRELHLSHIDIGAATRRPEGAHMNNQRRALLGVCVLALLALASLHERPGQTNSVNAASIRPDPAQLRMASLPIPAQGAISSSAKLAIATSATRVL